MTLHESAEMYLETILILSKTLSCVRSIDVGEYMGYSKPSVSRAMGLLRNDKFIEINGDGCIALTKDGQSYAEKIYERHVLLTEFLMAIGVDEETATKDACKIEHVISDKSFEMIKAHAKGKY